ncbi:hypothetical protein O0L34_g17633 [Tuta absoluta]|nr:hypothetical protein O0L34_g17633 [Tuta absoluta]
MKRRSMIKSCNFMKLTLCISLLLEIGNGYPIGTNKQIESEEKQYPNGTVVGKYTYIDKEGNPVEVKYYADDSSYGVELNSFTAIHEYRGEPIPPLANQSNKLDKTSKINDKETMPEAGVKGDLFDSIVTFKYPEPITDDKDKTNSDYPDARHKKEGTAHQKSNYKSPDYEVYAKDDMDSQQCGSNNEKVKVYNFVKNARKGLEDPEEEEEEVGGGEFCDI